MREPVEWVQAPVPEAARVLAAEGVPDPLAALLACRGVATAAAARAFLEPALDQLHDPFALAGVPAAVERLAAARERGERVAVVGDYDVDGVSGTALLVAVLRHCGLAVEAVLPHRLREGYGFQAVHVERAAALGCRVIVTVDCGTSSGDAARRALETGIDVVVTDHHLPGCELPPGVVQINPRQPGCGYPFRELSGAGLALKLAQAVAARLERPLELAALLRVACLGTIADLVPLVGENRTIAALGLRALEAVRSPGLQALIHRAGVRPPFTADDVGYRLGPRINAAGRLDDATPALELLLTRDPRLAAELALRLDGWNRDRQETEGRVVEEAMAAVHRRGLLAPIVVAWSDGWHRGVVGVAAGRLARELHRPTVLLAVEAAEAVGSGRSIPGIELHGFLDRWRHEMVRFGGHAQAVGLSVLPERLERLRALWEESAAAWPETSLSRRHEYELAIPAEGVGPELLDELLRLEPHGQGNPRPLLRVGPLRLAGAPRTFGRGERRHLAAAAEGERGGRVSLLGWGWAGRLAELAGRFEVLAHVERDRYTGAPSLRLIDSRSVAG
jgi:single-stranded-DNA-specific exonuclease